ncbi:MAG: cytosine permease [Actinomadura sp.]
MPPERRKSTLSVAAVWFGFPMIVTCAIFGGILAAMLGFQQALVAITLGNLVLMLYVGALSYLSGEKGLSFALISDRVFGRIGYIIPSAFLATVVIGWFAFQTGLTGLTVHQSYGWNEKLSTLIAGVVFIAVTFVGIRALAWLGMVAAPMFVLLSLVALWLIHSGDGLGGVWGYQGVTGGAGAMTIGAGITLVVATFADAGTMTGDFTRWAKNGRSAVVAAMSAFPVANFLAFLVGAVIVASGAITDPATNGGNFLPIVAKGHGWFLSLIAFLFIFVNLGSVCTHSLYNGAVGWSHILGSRMRVLTLILGVLGTIAALAGIWSHFLDWLNLLGVFVPSIGAIIIADQFFFRRYAEARNASPARWTAFAAWAAGATAAGVVHYLAPQYVEVLVGMGVAAVSYAALTAIALQFGGRRVAAEVH